MDLHILNFPAAGNKEKFSQTFGKIASALTVQQAQGTAKYRMSVIDEIDGLPVDIQGANLFFQLIAKRYEKMSTVFTANKTFSQWNEVFSDVIIVSAQKE